MQFNLFIAFLLGVSFSYICLNLEIYCLKQTIKTKEQECEGLKEDRERWKSNFNGKVRAIEELLQQLDQLKAEKEEIKKYLGISSKTIMERLEELQEFRDNDKYRLYQAEQTLTEIKEIAEENIRIADLEGLNGVYRRGLAKQILQKISESEVKND